ncbi:MAG: PBECR4 domain-containing protein [Clostridiales bacterium]|nr:PBECR4 domain-containing protein [Clostridiales bacterium]
MKDIRLLEIFQNVKNTICKYDYYIHTAKKIIHLSNTEDKIPHLMGLQYAGRPKQYTGDFGAYAIKKGRITMQSLEKLVQKYYKTEEKQRRILEVIHLKLDNLPFLPEMFASYSKLYLYDLGKWEDSDFDSDYLMVHEMEDKILHLGIIKTGRQEKDLCQCNSFMTTYKKDKNSDSFYRDLEHCYEINRIVREDKMTKRAEVIYLSSMAECRERMGIEKMLWAGGIVADEKLVTEIVKVNLKFGIYHTIDMLNDSAALVEKCTDKREKNLVTDFLALWNKKENSE